MGRVLDHVQDKSGEELYRLAQVYPLPEFVKKADMDLTMRPEKLAVTVYGDPRNQLYPCQNPAATFLSALFFQEKQAEFNVKDQVQIKNRIDGYATFHGITKAVEDMRTKWEGLHKTAEDKRPDSDYAYVWVGADGTKQRRLPLTTAMEVKAAADYIRDHRQMMPFQIRHAIAKRVLEKQANYGVGLGTELNEYVQKQAGRGVCEIGEVVTMIRNRAALVKHAAVRESFEKMASTVATAAQNGGRFQLTPGNLIKLAETLDTLDRKNGLHDKYCETFPAPEDVIFKVSFDKAASAMGQHVALTDGKVYEKQAFSRLSLNGVRDLFGDEFASRVGTPFGKIDTEKLAEEAATLPRHEAAELGRLLGDHGVAPSLVKAANERVGLSDAQWATLAETYRPRS